MAINRGTILLWVGVYETLKISWPTVVDAIRGREDMKVFDRRLASWSRRLVEGANVSLSVAGLENVDRDAVYVVMSNHRSNFDIPLLFQALPLRLRMVAKKELFRIPIFGRAMLTSGFVCIDRSNLSSAKASLDETRRQLGEGISMWIAPEGTRSRTDEMLAFKKGGFHVALQTGMPILPVALVGSEDILQPGESQVRSGVPVHVEILPPIVTTEFAGAEELSSLMEQTRARIAEGIEIGRKKLRKARTV